MTITKDQAFEYLLKNINISVIRDGSGAACISGKININTDEYGKFIYDAVCNVAASRERNKELAELARLKQKYETVPEPKVSGYIPPPPPFPEPVLKAEHQH